MERTIAAPVHTTVVGVFDYLRDARSAIDDLRRAGFSDDRIGFIGPDYRRSFSSARHHSLEENVEEGAGIGATVGAAAGGAAGLAMLAGLLPFVGPAIAGGALIAWLTSVGVGAASGAIVGGMVGLGVTEEDARWYESELLAGRTLVTVQEADERADVARDILREHSGEIREPSGFGGYGMGLPATPY